MRGLDLRTQRADGRNPADPDRAGPRCLGGVRGQGGSAHQLRNERKGHVEDFEDYLLDLDALIGAYYAIKPDKWR